MCRTHHFAAEWLTSIAFCSPHLLLGDLSPACCEEACPPACCLSIACCEEACPPLAVRRLAASVVAAMHALSFLRKDSHGANLKKLWKDDEPLPMSEGGAMKALSGDDIVALKESFHAGNSHQTLVCLTRISPDLSTPNLVLQENRLEGMGRKLWTTNKGKSAQVEPVPGVQDNFYTENTPQFPESWPEKGTLPVVIRNTARAPAQFKLLALDEMVASFWKIAAYCQSQIAVMKFDLAKADIKPERETYLKERLASYERQLEKARRLA